MKQTFLNFFSLGETTLDLDLAGSGEDIFVCSVIGSSSVGIVALACATCLWREGGRREEIGHNQCFPHSHHYIIYEAYGQCLDGPVGQLCSNIRNSTLLMAN